MATNRLTKKQLQRDEIQEAFVHAGDYVVSHRQQTVKWGAIAAGLLLAVGGIAYFVKWRETRLTARLSTALTILNAPSLEDKGGPTTAPGQKVYKDEAEKRAEAKKLLEELVKDSPSSRAGSAATLILLSMDGVQSLSGTRADAIKSLAQASTGSIVSGLAAVSLLEAQAAKGQANEAIELGKRFLESNSNPVPKDVLIYTLGKLYEKAGKPNEAKSFYQRVVSDFPDSPVRFEAQQKVQSL